MLIEENYKTLLRMAKSYEIPRLEKDVIVSPLPPTTPVRSDVQPHLSTLPLDPFDAYIYGKSYNLPNLISESYILRHFPLFLEAHFARLIASVPSATVDLVKAYVRHQSERGGSDAGVKMNGDAVRGDSGRAKTFREWLASEDSFPA
jgi:hypothetical protein